MADRGLLIFDRVGQLQYGCRTGYRIVRLLSRGTGDIDQAAMAMPEVPIEVTELCRAAAEGISGVASGWPAWCHRNSMGEFEFVAHSLNSCQSGSDALIAITAYLKHIGNDRALAEMYRYRLTERQQDICVRIMHGGTHKRIARDLSLSVHTVVDHVRKVYQKIGVKSHSELIRALLEPK